jgi:hypothetical protein
MPKMQGFYAIQTHLLPVKSYHSFIVLYYIRDVGVAGSNPVTPTIEFAEIFERRVESGSRLATGLGSNWGPALNFE